MMPTSGAPLHPRAKLREPEVSGVRCQNAELHAEISQHAGLLLFSPWFEDAFANAQPIIRQTAAQILLGAVNQEQSKHIDYNGLGLLTRPPELGAVGSRDAQVERHSFG